MILYRYIIREHILPFLYSFAIIVFFMIMSFAVQLLERIISKGLEPLVVLELFMIQLGWIVALAIPMAMLASALMTFGRMSADNEIVAIKASGRNLFHLLTPVLAAGIVLAVSLVFFQNLILPDANHRAANLTSDISRKRPAALIEPRVLIRDFQNYVLYVNKVNPRTGLMRGIKIFSDVPGQDPSTTVADSGYVTMTSDQQYIQLTLLSGESHSVNRDNKEDYFLGRFDKQVVIVQNVDSELRRTESDYRGDREKSSDDLLSEVKGFRQERASYIREFDTGIDSVLSVIRTLASLAADSGKDSAAADTAQDSLADFAAWASRLHADRSAAAASVRRYQSLTERTSRRLLMEDKRISQYLVEVHKKYSIAATAIVFVLIGAPLGIMARRGGIAVGATYSIFFFILFWALLIGGESLADRLVISPIVAMWTGPAVVGIFALLLIVQMVRERRIISFEPLAWFLRHAAATRFPEVRLPRVVRFVLAGPYALLDAPFFFLRKIFGILPMYLIKKFVGYFAGLLVALLLVFVIVDYVSNLKRFEVSSLLGVAIYYWYYLPWLIVQVLPIVVLLASMFSVGSLARHSELTAMKGAGIGVRQLTVPLLLVGVLIAVLGFYFGEKVLPQSNGKLRELKDQLREGRLQASGAGQDALGELRRNFFYFGDKQSVYSFGEFRTKPQRFQTVQRAGVVDNRIVQRIQAQAMDYRGGKWYFVNASVRDFHGDTCVVTSADTLPDTVLTATPAEMVARIKNKEEMSYWELKSFIDKVRRQGERVSMYTAELYFKIAFPIMNCIVILIGISITARIGRKGGAVLFGIGLAMVFAYWLIARFALAFSQSGQISPLMGAWFGNMLFLALGLVLYRKAIR